MSHLMIVQDNGADTTEVSNLFIDEYMEDANDAQLKVYLYLLRMMHAKKATSVSDIADKFNHTEKEVTKALKYWERRDLLKLDYDENKQLVGICLNCPKAEPVSSAPVAISSVSPTNSTPIKPHYTAKQILAFKEKEDISQLIFLAESYYSRVLNPTEINSLIFYSEELHFSEDLIDYLLQYCFEKGKGDFRYIDKVAIGWAEQGIRTPEEAKAQSCRYQKEYYTIMRQLGKDGIPTELEASYITRWLKEYCFTMEIILEACNRTVKATDKNRFDYAEGILSSWNSNGVHHLSDVDKLDEQYKARRKNTVSIQRNDNGSGNRFNQFSQNTYDFEQLEKELRSN